MRATRSAAAAAAASSPSSARAEEDEELFLAKAAVKRAFQTAGSNNFRWTQPANRATLAESLKNCLVRGVTSASGMLEAFREALAAEGEDPPTNISIFSDHAEEMSAMCLIYYNACSKEKHSSQTAPQEFNKQIADCVAFFSGSTEMSAEALNTFYAYGMALSKQSAQADKYQAALAANEKRLDEEAARGLQAAMGNAPKRARVSRKQRKEKEQKGLQHGLTSDEGAEGHLLDGTSGGGSGGKQGRSSNARSIELAKLKLEEEKFIMQMEEQCKVLEEQRKALEKQRKALEEQRDERAKAQKLERQEYRRVQSAHDERMLAAIKALQDKKS